MIPSSASAGRSTNNAPRNKTQYIFSSEFFQLMKTTEELSLGLIIKLIIKHKLIQKVIHLYKQIGGLMRMTQKTWYA